MDFELRYCHLGYATVGRKEFLVAVSCEYSHPNVEFEILDALGNTVFKSLALKVEPCDYTGEILYRGDFSSVKSAGFYRILVPELQLRSRYFEVSEEWLERQLQANIKSFYYQRSGVELPENLAGDWARPAAHLDNQLEFHPTMNRDGLWNAHGGWYDAGDYGKYIVNGGVSVATLMLACELCSDMGGKFVGGGDFQPTFRQPVSLLDEIRFELEFFLRMQDADGGVFFKVTPYRWDGFVTPAESDALQKRFILGKSTSSTLNFAAALSQAHRVYAKFDADFAAKCLDAAVRAYLWAEANPAVDWPHNTEGSGGYGDANLADDFFWARAMLYRELSGELSAISCDAVPDTSSFAARIFEQLQADMQKNPPSLGLQWSTTQNLGWYAIATMEGFLADSARGALKETAEKILHLQNEDPYGISIRRFIWGSNGDIANHALTLLLASVWSDDSGYREAALEQIYFIYGRNPVNVSFVTGSAWSSPKFPHHRISHSDGVELPVPGLLVGGINEDRQDLHRFPHYPGAASGFSYTDEKCSFASNETAINWNAPLTADLLILCCR